MGYVGEDLDRIGGRRIGYGYGYMGEDHGCTDETVKNEKMN